MGLYKPMTGHNPHEPNQIPKVEARAQRYKFKHQGRRTDLVEASSKLNHWPVRSQLEVLESIVPQNEHVIATAITVSVGSTGYLVLTDRAIHTRSSKLLFLHNERIESFPLGRISTVEFHAAAGFGEVTINAAESSVVIRPLDKEDAHRFVQAANRSVSNLIHEGPSRSNNGILDQIAQLADLHSKGAITAEEFAAKKTELLGRL